MTSPNYDQDELNKFARIAHEWWDASGKFRPLHVINPIRSKYINQQAPAAESRVLDIGCGGGLLCESLHQLGGRITGIDLSETPLQVAKQHAKQNDFNIEYLEVAAESLAQERTGEYDIVCCLEMLEHVPSPESIVRAAAELTRPGGSLFFSTINRNPLSWATAIVGAEYIFNALPRGTHSYEKLIRPSELAEWIRQAGLELHELVGLYYNPVLHTARLTRSVSINYMAYASRPAE